jgi:hypothetical protein
LTAETGVAVIALGGFSSWDHVPAFAWLAKELLPGAMRIFVILDRDYHTDDEVSRVLKELKSGEIVGHVWERKELESYVITPRVISNISGASVQQIETFLNECAELQRYHLSSQLAAYSRMEGPSGRDIASVIATSQRAFDAAWTENDFRWQRTNAKELLACLNSKLQANQLKPISLFRLVEGHREHDIVDEVADLLREIEGFAGATVARRGGSSNPQR